MKGELKGIKILGCYGGKGVKSATTCIQISKNIVIDAGNIIGGLGEDAKYINHIFLTHSHLDHIVDIPFLIDLFFEKRESPLFIYGLKETLSALKKYIFNFSIWPDFSQINILNSNKKSILFQPIDTDKEYFFEDLSLKAIETNHTVPSCGYVIKNGESSIFFTSDTYKCSRIWDEINSNCSIKSLIIESSFPSDFKKLAEDSLHLTPKILKEELNNLKRDDVKIYVNHLKPVYKNQIINDFKEEGLLDKIKILEDGNEIYF